ncbi:MAG: 3-oxoacyl-ACP reductase family protein [Acidobacteriota bacterium]|jgi:NAD(P)-dependent dehydrogenase (short-subunit alcohol dehydrogenase family)|nr:3-oxoacyl-ACP reductase family protein [Acidobacteriota bacterium]
MLLKDKVALVTGASRGIGRGIALEMAREGAAMAICHRNSAEQADEVAGQVREFGVPCLVLQADVSSAGDVSRLFDAVRSEYGRLDVLVNNAGTSQPKTILEMTEEDWDFIIDTNLKSTFLCCRAAVPIMRDLGGGRIINMTSIVSRRGALYGHVHYAASKGGINAFTMTLARDVAKYGIIVNAVAPGIVETELLHETVGDERIAQLSSEIPLGLGTVEDIGRACVYLASDLCTQMTGNILDVNGGAHMG